MCERAKGYTRAPALWMSRECNKFSPSAGQLDAIGFPWYGWPVLRGPALARLLDELGDKRPAGGNVLTHAVLQSLLQLHAATPHPDAPLVVYGEACRLGAARLAQANVVFKHIPYDVKAR